MHQSLLIAPLVSLALFANPAMAQDRSSIVFGNDTGRYAEDGECDDPRFEGAGMAKTGGSNDLQYKDASDCRAAFEAGRISVRSELPAPPTPPVPPNDGRVLPSIAPAPLSSAIDFGDDSGRFSEDGKCDDPRFEGPGMASLTPTGDLAGKDASDCRTLHAEGRVTLIDTSGERNSIRETGSRPLDEAPQVNGAFTAGNAHRSLAEGDFGNDDSLYANDGECDDPRFAGPGVALSASDEHLGEDASDCRAMVEAGRARWRDREEEARLRTLPGPGGFVFGADSSALALNGICDDMRFIGENVHEVQLGSDILADGSDCRTAFEAGRARHRVLGMGPFVARPDADVIDFGDDSGDFADNQLCDDARFTGEGMNPPYLQADIGRDAGDCRALYEAGSIQLH
ncbi:hypothetical protein [Sphingomicrobium arenosum]|uniref:hypothetical protein n=1 Tax=Sphingomicrobium arenosum TaxID=2233861 RepID=UPI00223FF793|nr:hypothetical protein [Sphingomicrobium arenosum]